MGVLSRGEHILASVFYIVWTGHSERKVGLLVDFKSTSKKTKTLIHARVNEGFTLENFKSVIDIKTSQWKNDKAMCKYLRPETLFGTKFEGYLNEAPPITDSTEEDEEIAKYKEMEKQFSGK